MPSSLCPEHSPECLPGCCPSSFLGQPERPEPPDSGRQSTVQAHRRDFASRTLSSIFPNTKSFTDPESLPSLLESFAEFSGAYPQFSATKIVDRIRDEEYYHLSMSHRACLNYMGIGLFSYSQLNEQDSASVSGSPFFRVSRKKGSLKDQLLHCGPESELEFAMRRRVMRFLKISENDYSMVFTVNRTSAFKLLAEAYPFQSSRKLLTVYDSESEAIEAMVRVAQSRGGQVFSAEFSWPRLGICKTKLGEMIATKKRRKNGTGLFVFPLHSRTTGARYPYLWMNMAEENGWHVLVDACALGPKDMNSFALSIHRPDFIVCTFYKIFSENPSGFGCLFVKKSTIPLLGASTSPGMVSLVPPDRHVSWSVTVTARAESREASQKTTKSKTKSEEKEVSETFRHGESDCPVKIECRGLDHVDSLALVTTGSRTRCLINWLVQALMKLKHSNAQGTKTPLVKVYGPKINFDRGPALAFNVFDPSGKKLEPVAVQKLADQNGISLGCGFITHIWFKDKYREARERVLETIQDKTEPGISVLTATLGFLSNFEDVYKLWVFVAQFLDPDFGEKEGQRELVEY